MKKNIIIILSLVVAQLFAFNLISHSQIRDKCPSVVTHDTDTILLADETTLNYNKTEAVIKCSNETVFNSLFKSHGTLFKRFICTWKSDRYGRYKHYIVYLAKGDAELIVNWAKSHL